MYPRVCVYMAGGMSQCCSKSRDWLRGIGEENDTRVFWPSRRGCSAPLALEGSLGSSPSVSTCMPGSLVPTGRSGLTPSGLPSSSRGNRSTSTLLTRGLGVRRPVRVVSKPRVKRGLRSNLDITPADDSIQQKSGILANLNAKITRNVVPSTCPDEPLSLRERQASGLGSVVGSWTHRHYRAGGVPVSVLLVPLEPPASERTVVQVVMLWCQQTCGARHRVCR